MSLEFKNLIKHEFNKNKLLFNSELIEALEVFAQFLISENKKYNLTTILTPEDIVNKHFIDSILGFEKFLDRESLKKSFQIMDIGTGAGFPGIPLLLYDQTCKDNQRIKKIHLLDSSKKKTDVLFLMKLKIEKIIDPDLIEIHNSRLEDLFFKVDCPDLYLSRATGKIDNVAKFLDKFLKNNFKYVFSQDNKEIYFLHYGGPESVVLPDNESRLFKLNKKIKFKLNRQVKNIYKYQFSSNNYLRKNVLYSITNQR